MSVQDHLLRLFFSYMDSVANLKLIHAVSHEFDLAIVDYSFLLEEQLTHHHDPSRHCPTPNCMIFFLSDN